MSILGKRCNDPVARIGGDSDISDRGQQYAMALSYFFNHQVGSLVQLGTHHPVQTIPGLRVWTSWLKRTIQTSAHITAPQVASHGSLPLQPSL